MQVGSSLPQSPRSRDLEQAIRALIRRDGPLPLVRFMEMALYDPRSGYYSAGPLPWGTEGDYVTAPQVHPALGESIARFAIELDAALGNPTPFVLVEAGGGNGALGRQVLASIRAGSAPLWERLAFTSVERGAAAREVQIAALRSGDAPGGGWRVESGLSAPAAPWKGLVYANELLDALPVHRVRNTAAGLTESHVDIDVQGRLQECYLPPSTPSLARYLEINGVTLQHGQVAEICLQVETWLGDATSGLAAGGLLAIDYGHPTEALYGPARGHGTLVAQQRFQLFDDVLSHPGDRDLTAHVDFGNLERLGAGEGLHAGGRCSLRVFLIGMGAAAVTGSESVRSRLALRHLLVSEIGDTHSVTWLQKGVRDLPFGRARLGPPG